MPEEQGQTCRHSPSPPHPEEDAQEPSIPAKKSRAEVKPLKLRESHSDSTELDGGFDTVHSQDFDSETPVPGSELTSTVTCKYRAHTCDVTLHHMTSSSSHHCSYRVPDGSRECGGVIFWRECARLHYSPPSQHQTGYNNTFMFHNKQDIQLSFVA